MCAKVVQMFSNSPFSFCCWRWTNFSTLRKCALSNLPLQVSVVTHKEFPIRSCCANTMGLAGLQDSTSGTWENDYRRWWAWLRNNGNSTDSLHHWEREGGVKLTTDSRILRIHRLWSLLYKEVIRDVVLQFWNHIHTMVCITFIRTLASTPLYECT